MAKLKPCPFCGGEAKPFDNEHEHIEIDENGAYVDMVFDEADAYWVECMVCGAMGSSKNTFNEAAEAWNRRATDG